MVDKNIVWFEEVEKHDTPLVGGKGANLGEMLRAGIPIPYGFIITVHAYDQFIAENNLKSKIEDYLNTTDFKDTSSLNRVSSHIKKEIIKSPIPKQLAREIIKYYYQLPQKARAKYRMNISLKSLFKDPLVAIRSSATAEDLPGASFAGQQATFLDIKGEANLLENVRAAWASLFEPRAIFYRHEQHIDQFKVKIAVPVQLMVTSDASGVMFTIDPITNDKSKVVIEAVYGLGEMIVQGTLTPDHFEMDKKTGTILAKQISTQAKMMVKAENGAKVISVPENKRNTQKISDKLVKEIALLGLKIEKHYFFPQDIEWATEDNQVYIVQSRPVTTISSQLINHQELRTKNQELIVKGDPASPGIAFGPAKVITSAKEIHKIVKGDILVAPQTDPDFVPAMKKAAAIITERGGRTSHAAIVSRELGIPAVVGALGATKLIKPHLVVTVNGATGEVFKGGIQRSTIKNSLTVSLPTKHNSLSHPHLITATKVYVNLGEPSRAKETSKLNVDGVGLLRAEFMIADIGIHPKKLIKEGKEKVFIHKLADDLLAFTQAFSPRLVVYRATDFKTNEYGHLKGGGEFEPIESNPMLGYRGAYRYVND
ncbi:phosphoenolpyruvate synthase, partial [Candidatus Gottesmanbacteria bacterium]|nr:phosphoenolpyruvate synthase [Candidatus Gottesmanbacteria bacterium]